MSTFGDRIFMTPAEIYRQLTEGPGTGRLGLEQQQTYTESTAEGERAELIKSLANAIRAGWQGDASEGAYGAAMPLAERAFENADKLDHSQDLLSRQIDSFATAANSVRPVSDAPDSPIDEKFPFDVDYDKAVKDYQDSAQHNIAVFREYDGASHYNETNIPQEYGNSSRAGGDVSVKAPADTIEVGEPGLGDSAGPGDVGGPEGTGGDSSYPGGPSTGDFPGGPGGSLTSPNDYRPSAGSSSPGSSSSVGQSSAAGVSGGFVGGVPVGYSGGGFGPRGGGGVGGAPVGGYAGGGGTGGPRGGAGGAGGSGGVRGGGAGLGSGAGARAGALAAEEAAARRAGQAAAGAKSGAMGAPVGAARGKDDEDAEHQRKVLLEADAEGTFGSDALTAPQVIGDDEYEDR